MEKNLLLITSRLDMGGGPRHVFELSKRISNQTIFVAGPIDEPFAKKIKDLNIDFFEIPHRKFSLLSLIRLLMWIKKNNINLIHSHGFGAGIYSRLLSLFGLTIIHTMHGCHTPNSLMSFIKLFIERFFTLLTDNFIFISKDEYEQAKSLKIIRQQNFQIINNGVDPSEYQQSNVENKTLGTLSRLDPHKDNLSLIKNFQALLLKDSTFQLKIAGDGEEKENLKKFIQNHNLSNNVELLGEVSSPKGFLSSIEYYVSHSKSEGLPYSVLEAMASGKKIVLTNVPGHRGLVDQKCLFSNTQEFVDLVLNFDSDSIKSNRSKIEKRFNLNFSIKKLEDFYASIKA